MEYAPLLDRNAVDSVSLSDVHRELLGIRTTLQAHVAQAGALHQIQAQAYEERLLTADRYQVPANLARFSHQVCSQHGEDGIISEIFRRIGAPTSTFIEIGVGSGLENNTCCLLLQGWQGSWIDGSERSIDTVRRMFSRVLETGRLRLARALITVQNIEPVLAALGSPPEVDLLSLDIDRNTYWAWAALTTVRPRVVVIEYNAQFPPGMDWVIDYQADLKWSGTGYFGASLTAYERLGREKGYSLVGCSLSGVNAFFVRDDLCGNLFDAPFSTEHHFEPARYFLIRRTGHAPSFGDGA